MGEVPQSCLPAVDPIGFEAIGREPEKARIIFLTPLALVMPIPQKTKGEPEARPADAIPKPEINQRAEPRLPRRVARRAGKRSNEKRAPRLPSLTSRQAAGGSLPEGQERERDPSQEP